MSSIIRVKSKPRIQVDFQEMGMGRMQLGWNRQLGADEKDVGRLPDVTRARIL